MRTPNASRARLAARLAVVIGLTACAAAAQAPSGGQYAGSETCQACHQDFYEGLLKNPHHLLETAKSRGWQSRSCEACHGPGAKHVESASPDDIRNPARLPVQQADGICQKCHLTQKNGAGVIQGEHGRNGVGCLACHTMHKEPDKVVLKKPAEINALCSSCHLSVKAQFQRPHHHKLPEGALSCADCHNPHGSFLPKSQQTAFGNDPGCLRCHADKRGAFAFEHAPVRLEGCATCHEPHGSANPRMLIRHEQRFLCLECHASVGAAQTLGGVPPAFHDLRSARFRNCTICHVKIHGSQVNRSLLR